MSPEKTQTESKRILCGINSPYRSFFSIGSGVKSLKNRLVAVLAHSQYEAFLNTLAQDPNMDQETKVLIAVLASGGQRISEALKLRRIDFKSDGECLEFYTRVAKKHRFIERKSTVHSLVTHLVKEYLLHFRGLEKIFDLSRHNALYRIKGSLGKTVDIHALRRAHISYLLFNQRLTEDEVENILKLSPEMITKYANGEAA